MRRLLTGLAILAVAGSLAACGDDEDETTVTETTGAATQTEQTSASDSSEPVDCMLPPPDGAGFFDLFATKVDCTTAENVRQAWSTQCAGSDTGVEDCAVIEGFSCTYERQGYELGQITCNREDDGAVVTFKTGA